MREDGGHRGAHGLDIPVRGIRDRVAVVPRLLDADRRDAERLGGQFDLVAKHANPQPVEIVLRVDRDTGIAKTVDPADQRRKLMRLAPKAERYVGEVRDFIVRHNNAVFEPLTEENSEFIATAFRAMARNSLAARHMRPDPPKGQDTD